jgi:hypothetical protein
MAQTAVNTQRNERLTEPILKAVRYSSPGEASGVVPCRIRSRQGFEERKSSSLMIEVHKRDWTVQVLCQGEELHHATITPEPERLIATLKRFEASEIHRVYDNEKLVCRVIETIQINIFKSH